MRLLFYKGQNSVLEWLVAKWTGGPYSHIELQFSDGELFSAMPRQGVRFARFFANPNDWDGVPLRMNRKSEADIRKWCQQYEGADYDFLAIVRFAAERLGIRRKYIENPTRWYCSEIINLALIKNNLLKIEENQIRVHPNRMWKNVNLVENPYMKLL